MIKIKPFIFLIFGLVAIVPISSEKPRCLDCANIKVKCRSAESLGCPKDYEISKCSCCPQCKTKTGMESTYPPSIPAPGRCNLKNKCENISCIALACPYGNDPLACSCCATCLKGPTENCGGKNNENGRCAKDHICVTKFYQPIDTTKPYAPIGYCRSRFCPDCALVDCVQPESLKCEKGTIPDSFCGCCPACKKGLHEICGGPSSSEGACPRNEALVCKNDKGKEIFPEEIKTQVGKCEYGDGLSIPDRGEPCPNCAATSCALVKCQYLSELDPVCGCCPVCRQGLGAPCGGKNNKNGICGDKFVCENSKCVERVKPGCIDCRLVRCASPESIGCPNNYKIDPCKCCPECVKY